jgi:hypothetical protein
MLCADTVWAIVEQADGASSTAKATTASAPGTSSHPAEHKGTHPGARAGLPRGQSRAITPRVTAHTSMPGPRILCTEARGLACARAPARRKAARRAVPFGGSPNSSATAHVSIRLRSHPRTPAFATEASLARMADSAFLAPKVRIRAQQALRNVTRVPAVRLQ